MKRGRKGGSENILMTKQLFGLKEMSKRLDKKSVLNNPVGKGGLEVDRCETPGNG